METKERPEFESANLTVEETQELADEIRKAVIGDRGVTMPDYLKAARAMTASKLGYRKSRALKCETSLITYFPDDVFHILQKIDGVATGFNDDDDRFLRENINQNVKWLSSHLYASKNTLYQRIRTKKFNRERVQHIYTKAEETFIHHNAHKGIKWLSKEINVSNGSMLEKMKRMGLWIPDHDRQHVYTQKEEKYIREHIDEGTVAVAKALNLSSDAIGKKIVRMGLKYALPKRRKK